jgi:ribosome recycling factor
MEAIKKDASERMRKAVAAFRDELTHLRGNRASPGLLEQISVHYQGSDMPLKAVATVAATDARTLTITPWDRALIGAIEKAIMAANIGLTPTGLGESVRVAIPPLTEERRSELARLIRAEAEKARVAVRNIRRDALATVKAREKDKTLPADQARRGQEAIQGLTDRAIVEIDGLAAQKERDIMEV